MSTGKWCPKCHRFDMEYNHFTRHEVCLWNDCLFVNLEDVDLDIAFTQYTRIHGTKFKEFAKTIKPLTDIMDT